MKIYLCENCGKEHDGSYGSGRFCSSHCRRVWIGKHSVETRKQRGTFVSGFAKKARRSPYGTWKCERCNLVFETRRKLEDHSHIFHPIAKGSSWNKGLTKETDDRIAKYVQTNIDKKLYGKTWKGKHLSAKHRAKTSSSLKKFYKEHPELVPYKLHHSSKESYPEKYFNELFLKENITGFKRDFYVDGYYLDYAFLDKKIDFEVDGSQHYVDQKIVEHDKIRTQHLEFLGWKVIRVDWRIWQKLDYSQKHSIVEELKRLVQ